MKHRLLILCASVVLSAWASLSMAQVGPAPGIALQDEGVGQGRVQILNCVGSSIACAKSGITGMIDVTGGGGAPTGYAYWGSGSDATLSAEINLGLLGTGLVINTTGTPSIYAGTSCTNQFPRSLSASGAATCADVAASDFGSQTANLVLAAPDGAPGDPTFRALVDADIPNTITLTNLTQIGTRAISDTTGTLLVPRGGSGLTTVSANQLYVGTAADTFTAKTIPSCSNATTDKLLYDNATQTISCGTDQGGGGGGLTHPQIMARVSLGF